ncbi:MAG: RNA methyltransferase [Chloroflexi bacterium]|nr:RNA methyltransferase [Chloroflexota bacterium]MBI1856389.1 RNA methyltransferase [Chloroflexota bacterium]MBI3339615.1 RNA methyltransferase [Chloroflexota bacterium]
MPKPMDITSLQNPRVKYFVKLREDKKQRRQDGLMLVEGFDEIALALSAGYKPHTLLAAPELATRQIDFSAAENISVTRAVFEKISYRDNPDGWLAIFPIPKISLDDLKLSPSPLIVVAESVEKPGNLGAILRTADAARVDALIVCDARTDIYNPNVVRASRGTLFTVPTVEASNQDALSFLRRNGTRILAASPQADSLYTTQDLRGPLALAVGSEDEGLTDFWLGRADVKVKIPMTGKVNSLNVSIAAALIIYEAVRQRTSSVSK